MSSFDDQHDLDKLFFGATKVYLAPVEGSVDLFPPRNGWAVPPTRNTVEWENAVAEAAALSEPLAPLGQEYENVVQPGIVAVSCWPNKEPLERKTKTSPAEDDDKHPAVCPVPITPLLKHPEATAPSTCLVGVASGVRSAILKFEGRWLRLKGCGNHDEGFPAKEMGTLPSGAPSINVRGSCFESTVNREACMTSHVASLLDQHGIPIGNRSVAAFHYHTPSNTEDGQWPAWPYPLVTRHCGVFETVGDRRAGDHLIGGIEQLLHMLLPLQEDTLVDLSRKLNELRGLPLDVDLATTDMLPYLMDPPPSPAACVHAALPQSAPPFAKDLSAVPAHYAALWDQEVNELTTFFSRPSNNASKVTLAMALGWRIGWECGRVQSILIDGEVSWGTFPDSMGTHCNAHANNMVVLPLELSTKNNCLLAPVDLDLAFHRSGYIQELANQYKGFDSDWSDLMRLERQGFYATLAGSDFASTGVSNSANSEDPRRIALRDTICAGFNAGIQGAGDEYVTATVGGDAAQVRACASLVRLALIITTGVET